MIGAAIGLLAALATQSIESSASRAEEIIASTDPLTGHEGAVMMGAFTPDGRRVITVSSDLTARMWDVTTGAELRQYAQHTGPLYSLAISADGRTLVTTAQDNTLRAWDVPLNDPVRTFKQHDKPVRGLVISPDGQTLLSASADMTVSLESVVPPPEAGTPAATAAAVPELRQGHEAELLSLDYRPDGAQFASADAAGQIIFWSPYLKEPQQRVTGHLGPVKSVRFLSNNTQAATAGDDGLLRVWQLQPDSGKQLPPFAADVADLELLTNQPIALYGSVDGTSRAVNLTTDETIIEFPKQPFKLTSVVAAPNNTWVALAGETGVATLLNYADGTPRGSVAGHTGAINNVVIHPDNVRFATASVDGTARLWQQPQPSVDVKGHTAPIRGVASSIGGQWFATISDEKKTRLWTAAGAAQRELANHEQPLRAVAIRDDDTLLATGDAAGVVWLWNPANGAVEGFVQAHAGAITSLTFSADRTTLITAGADNTVRSWTLPLPKEKPAAEVEPTKPAWEFAVPGNVALTSLHRTAGEPAGYAGLLANGAQIIRIKTDGTAIPAVASPAGKLVSLDVARDGLTFIAVNEQGAAHMWAADGTAKGSLALGASITSARFNADATELLVSDNKPRVRIFGVTSQQLLEEIVSPLAAVDAVWTGTDQRTIAAIGAANDAIVLPRTLLRTFETNPVDPANPPAAGQPRVEVAATSLMFTPDQQNLLCGTNDGRVLLWNITTGELTRSHAFLPVPAENPLANAPPMVPPAADGESKSIIEFGLSANQSHVVALGAEGVIRTSQFGDAVASQSFSVGKDAHAMTISPDGTRITTAHEDGYLRVWELTSGRLLETLAGRVGSATDVRYLADGQTLISTGADKSLHQSKTSIVRAMPVSEGMIRDMVLYANSAQTLSGDDQGRVVLSDINTGNEVRLFKWVADPPVPTEGDAVAQPVDPGTQPAAMIDYQPSVVASRSDNQRIVAGTQTGSVFIWNANDGSKPLLQFSLGETSVTAIAYSPDNQKLAIATADNTVRIFGPSIPNTQPVEELMPHQAISVTGGVSSLLFARDNRSLLVALDNGQVEEWGYAAPGQIRQFNHGGPVYGAAISKEGRIAVTCSADQTVRVFDIPANQQKFQLSGHTGPVHAIAMSPDETFAVSSGSDGTLRLWDIVGGRQLKQLTKFEATMYSVAIHPEGQLIAAAGADRKVHLLDMITGAETRTLEGHTDYIHSVSFSPDGTKVASYGYAGYLKIWNTADGKLLHESRVGKVGNDASFSPDGKNLLLSNGDSTARIIPTPVP